MKFTKANIAALQLPAGKSDHIEFDGSTPGFGIRLRSTGDRIRQTWIAQIRVHGQTRRLSLGNVAQIDLEPARAAARKFFAQGVLGADPAAERALARARAAYTVGVAIERYLEARKPALRPNTHRHNARYLRHYFAGLHKLPVSSVTRADVAGAVAEIAKQHGQVSAARARSTLSACFAWALKEGIAEANPVINTNNPADEKPRDRILKPEELRAIWQALPHNTFGAIVRLLCLTACRRSEISLLEWSEINLDKASLTIPGRKMKSGREHRLPLVTEAVELLRSIPRRDGNPFVFSRGFTAFAPPLRELRDCLAAAGVVTGDWRLHDIRRTVKTEMSDLGIDPWVSERVLGHTRGGIEGTYDWSKMEGPMRTALQLWADRLRSIVEETKQNVVKISSDSLGGQTHKDKL